MPELFTKANQAILEAQWLRREQRSLRFEANVLAGQLGETIVRSHVAQSGMRQALLDSRDLTASRLMARAVGVESAAESGDVRQEEQGE